MYICSMCVLHDGFYNFHLTVHPVNPGSLHSFNAWLILPRCCLHYTDFLSDVRFNHFYLASLSVSCRSQVQQTSQVIRTRTPCGFLLKVSHLWWLLLSCLQVIYFSNCEALSNSVLFICTYLEEEMKVNSMIVNLIIHYKLCTDELAQLSPTVLQQQSFSGKWRIISNILSVLAFRLCLNSLPLSLMHYSGKKLRLHFWIYVQFLENNV